MKIALVNVSSDANRGACALTWASLYLLTSTFPQASIAIVPAAETNTPAFPYPFRHTRRRYPEVAILAPLFDGQGKPAPALLWRLARSLGAIVRLDRKLHHSNPTLEWIRSSDLIVSVGGVTFETHGGTLREDARFLTRLLPLFAARKMRIPIVLVGAQIGPFKTRFGSRLFASVAANAAMMFPRDRQSEMAIRSVTAKPRHVLMPDSAFALKLPASETSGLLGRHGLAACEATLALVISSALRPDESVDAHVALFAEAARQLIERGPMRRIIVVVQHDEDRSISRQLANSLRLDDRCVIDDDLDPGQLSSLYGVCEMVVSSRLHAVILAMLSGTPAVSLAPEVTFKEKAVLDLVGLASFCVPTEAGPAIVATACLDIAGRLDEHRKTVSAAVSAARLRLAEIPRYLRETVASRR